MKLNETWGVRRQYGLVFFCEKGKMNVTQ